MKKFAIVVGGALLGLCIILTVAVCIITRLENKRSRTSASIAKETGLTLPSSAHVADSKAAIFSLADGPNYEWLIVSDESLLEWAEANMKREDNDKISWKHIKSFNEISPFKEVRFEKLKLASVWIGTRRAARGHEETSYLFLCEGEKVGVIETFRP